MLKLSTRQKREIYSLSSLLLHLLVFVILLISLNSCTQKEEEVNPECDTLATVKDMGNLGGCGIMLQLDNGIMLQPIFPNQGWCGTVAYSQGSPIDTFELRDGQRVKFSYRQSNNTASICNMGQTVEITCLTKLDISDYWPETNPAPTVQN